MTPRHGVGGGREKPESPTYRLYLGKLPTQEVLLGRSSPVWGKTEEDGKGELGRGEAQTFHRLFWDGAEGGSSLRDLV